MKSEILHLPTATIILKARREANKLRKTAPRLEDYHKFLRNLTTKLMRVNERLTPQEKDEFLMPNALGDSFFHDYAMAYETKAQEAHLAQEPDYETAVSHYLQAIYIHQSRLSWFARKERNPLYREREIWKRIQEISSKIKTKNDLRAAIAIDENKQVISAFLASSKLIERKRIEDKILGALAQPGA